MSEFRECEAGCGESDGKMECGRPEGEGEMPRMEEREGEIRETGMPGEEKLTLEDYFEKLEQTIGRLEEEDISLEEAFRAYSEGMRLLKECDGQIDRVEKKVLKLTEEGALEEL